MYLELGYEVKISLMLEIIWAVIGIKLCLVLGCRQTFQITHISQVSPIFQGLLLMQINEKCISHYIKTSNHRHYFPWRLETVCWSLAMVCIGAKEGIRIYVGTVTSVCLHYKSKDEIRVSNLPNKKFR